MENKWPYNYRFVECYIQDLFKTDRSILVQFPSSFFSMCFVSVYVVHLYSSMDTVTVWKKSPLILLDRSDLYLIYILSIAFHAFARCFMISLSVVEILLQRYVNWSINFRGLPRRVEITSSYFICIHVKVNAYYSLLLALPSGFGLGWCIWEECYIIFLLFLVWNNFLLSNLLTF